MPRPRKYADMVVRSFSVERQFYETLRAVLAGRGKSISEEVNELLKKRLAELEGQGSSSEKCDYEALKREHVKLTEETLRLIGLLKKIGDYEALIQAAEDQGLNMETLDNAEETAAKLLKTWQGSYASLHIFITLLETARKRTSTEQKLEEIRLKENSNKHS